MRPIDGIYSTMHAVNVSKLDLGLLVVLGALVERGSVTGAARSLGLTQPTVSHALARLREVLGDPVLVRSGRGMVRTPRAVAVAPVVQRILRDASRVLSRDAGVDVATFTRTFAVACPDLLVAFLPELLGRVARESPGVRIEARAPPADLATHLAEGAIDLAVLPPRSDDAGLVQRVLGEARWCVLARRGHPAVRKGQIDLAGWLRFGHVVVGTAEGTGIIGAELLRRGHERRVAFVAPSFLAAPHAIMHTDWFFAAPREPTIELADKLGLVVLDPPIPLPPVRIALVWHERMHADAGHRWLRELFAQIIGAALAPGKKVKRSAAARPTARGLK